MNVSLILFEKFNFYAYLYSILVTLLKVLSPIPINNVYFYTLNLRYRQFHYFTFITQRIEIKNYFPSYSKYNSQYFEHQNLFVLRKFSLENFHFDRKRKNIN